MVICTSWFSYKGIYLWQVWNINITNLLIYTDTNCYFGSYCLAKKFNLHRSIQAKEIISSSYCVNYFGCMGWTNV